MHEQLDWNDLTFDEQRVMTGAIDASELPRVWAGYLPDQDVFNYERGYLYVPALALAARHLVELDYVVVSGRETPDGQYVHMAKSDAIKALADIQNWGIPVQPKSEDDMNSNDGVQTVKYYLDLADREQLIVNFVDPPPMAYIDNQ